MQMRKNLYYNDDIVNVTMLEEVAFISFLFPLVIILWLTDESQELGQTFSL